MNDGVPPEDDLALWREYAATDMNTSSPPGRDGVGDFSPTAPWRSLPPTAKQLACLERDADHHRGRWPTPFTPPRTRGEASDRIQKIVDAAQSRERRAVRDGDDVDHDDYPEFRWDGQ